nr:hypothetical protein [Tanacetum cinerariifolium]
MALTIEDKNSNPSSVLYDAKKKTIAFSLPQDVIQFQILVKVPTKSVSRFKCVSKQWNSFLMSDKFKEMHSRNLLKEPHLEGHNLFFFIEKEAALFTINCESLPNKAPRRCILPPLEASPPEYSSDIQSTIGILTSFHGLVCLGIRENNRYSDIILWNPLTSEYKILPKPPNHIECYKSYGRGYGLYYSSCEDDYKLLLVTHDDNVYVYSLKSDSWRNLNKKAPFKKEGFCWRSGFCLSENIYFLSPNPAKFSIRFDTRAERFHKIKTPREYDNTNYPHCTSTTVHRGSIHLCVLYIVCGRSGFMKSTCIELWKFNADGDIWSKMETYQLMPNHDIGSLSPLHLMSNGKWLMWDHRTESRGGSRICQVDLKKKKYCKDIDGHKCKGKNKRKGSCYDEYKLYYSDVRVNSPQKVRYTETFVSPNHSCEDDYKLLLVTHDDNVYVYSLKSDSWRNLNKKAPFQKEAKFSIRFDTRAERFHKIKTPPEYDNTNYPHCTSTTVHRGSIHLCVKYIICGRSGFMKSTCIELWKFNADGDIWSKVVTYQLMPNHVIGSLSPLHLMSNGKWLMWDHRPKSCGGGRICQVDLKKKKYYKDIDGYKCKGKNKSKGNCYDKYKLLYYSDVRVASPQEVRYTETFVSPNRRMVSQCQPNHTFVMSLAIQGNLLTHDRMLVLNPNADLKCPVCKLCPDSHSHLFIECEYSRKVWCKLKQIEDSFSYYRNAERCIHGYVCSHCAKCENVKMAYSLN